MATLSFYLAKSISKNRKGGWLYSILLSLIFVTQVYSPHLDTTFMTKENLLWLIYKFVPFTTSFNVNLFSFFLILFFGFSWHSTSSLPAAWWYISEQHGQQYEHAPRKHGHATRWSKPSSANGYHYSYTTR